ncbi:hypothetical protein J2Y38_004119 [Flavobacterium sp. 2755]|uniref:hypothetical protein n=1 Tax=Flavobacterium sp. 2755 TaxID=2817765 RepID=UPI002854DE78|nr:hypothetical protein [Flavobacterium sp. 2755]MDR6763895.1 hypothetical protein [Flavobacterium sp. 2755]
MQNYYNFTVSASQISYNPYWYVKSNIILKCISGILVLASGFVLSHLSDFNIGFIISILISAVLIFNGIYKFMIKNKTTFIFDKTDNALYKITLWGNKKVTSLNNVIDIISKSRAMSYHYVLTSKDSTKIKKIKLTASIKNENKSNPEVRFLEMEIIPQLESFLNLNSKVIVFDSKYCSTI